MVEGKQFKFDPSLGMDERRWKQNMRRAGRGALRGARVSLAGPVRLTFAGAVLGVASWVSHPSHDHINTDFDRAEHLGNAAEELNKIKPQDEALQSLTVEVQRRETEIRDSGSYKWEDKRAQTSYYGQVLSGVMMGTGAIWYGIRRKRRSYEEQEMADAFMEETTHTHQSGF